MELSILMIFNNDTLFEVLLSAMSIVEQRKPIDKFQFIFISPSANKSAETIYNKYLKSFADISFYSNSNIHNGDDIWEVDLRAFRFKYPSILIVQKNILVRKSLRRIVEKYSQCTAIGRTKISPDSLQKVDKSFFDLGFIITNRNAISDSSFCIENLCKQHLITNFELEEYFYVHPMISVQEANRFLSKSYNDFNSVQECAVAVRLYSTIETRLRAHNDCSKEWCEYLCKIPEAYIYFTQNNNIEIEKKGIFKKIYMPSETIIALGRTYICKKIYLENGYKIKVLGATVKKELSNGFYINKYYFGIKIKKEINFTVIDNLIVERINILASELRSANQRLNKGYLSKASKEYELMKVSPLELNGFINNLELYHLFKDMKKGIVSPESEIRLKTINITDKTHSNIHIKQGIKDISDERKAQAVRL